jgi:multicomponent Na+:H+ antiporter subunit E
MTRALPLARRLARGLAFTAFYLRELVVSSVAVAVDVLRPRMRMVPGVIALPLEARTDGEITVLANLISLTPGTLALEVAPDRRTLYLHAMHLPGGDPEPVRQAVRERIEARVLAVFRG